MTDPNMVEFYKRAARLELQRASGKGFEAAGALGRSHFRRPAQTRRSLLWPALLVLAVAFVMKGAIYFASGSDLYDARVAELRAGDGVVEQIGGVLMQADPLTLWVSGQLAWGVQKVTT